MNREEALRYIEKTYKVKADHPWAKTPENAVLRHNDTGKWFALIMDVRADKLGLEGSGYIDIINLKCEPFLIDSLILKDGFHRAYHMNKSLWITARLDGSADSEEIKRLIDLSFELTDKN